MDQLSSPVWKGPYEHGITQSLITKFIQCPYRFYLYAIKGLVDDVPLPPNLIWGDVFHKGLELYIASKDLNSSIMGMAEYQRNTYPQAPPSYATSTQRMLRRFPLHTYEGDWTTEITFKQSVSLPSGREVYLRGKKDAYTTTHPEKGVMLGEHKCKGFIDPAQLRREIKQDRQINIYCYLHGIEWINYDLILIPESVKYAPARKYNESPQEWISRLFTGPCGNYQIFPINSNSDKWIHNAQFYYPREEQEVYWQQTIIPDLERICDWWDYVTHPTFDPDNPEYNAVFYKTPVRQFVASATEKFECEYYKLLIGEEDMSSLKKIPTVFAELDDDTK